MGFKAKTTATVDKELGSVSIQFAKAAEELKLSLAAVDTIDTKVAKLREDFTNLTSDYNTLIDESEAKLAGLEAQYKEKERTMAVNVDLNIKQYGVTQAASYLASTHKVLTLDEFNKLSSDVKEAETSVKTAVASVTRDLKSEHAQELLKITSAHSVAEAENKAQIKSLTLVNESLTKQVAELTAMIDKERDANTARAQAASVGQITVNSGK